MSPAAAPPPRKLCLWGPSSAGKTALLAQLVLSEAPPGSAWEVLPAAQTQSFVETVRQRIRLDNRFPAATNPGVTAADAADQVALYFRRRDTLATVSLALEDHAGVRYEEYEPVREALVAADGLVLLLDAVHHEARLESHLRRTLERLSHARANPSQRDPRPIAVCLSKADRWIHTRHDLERAEQDPEDFVRERLAGRHLAPLVTYCDRFRLFPVSAVGVHLKWGAAEPAVFIDEQGAERLCPHARPLNLLAPFIWVLDQLADMP